MRVAVTMRIVSSARMSWQLWPGQGWPFSLCQEADFVADLARVSGSSRTPARDRDAISILLMVFRCGTPLEEVLRLAPGLAPERLLSAYRVLESARMEAVHAWEHIEEHPTSGSLWESAEKASLVLPVVTHAVLSRSMSNPSSMVSAGIADAAAEVHKVRVLALGIEAVLRDVTPGDPRGIELGTQLYNPVSPGIYGSPYYLPDRVSSLTPLRVRDLLGEPRR